MINNLFADFDSPFSPLEKPVLKLNALDTPDPQALVMSP